MNRLSSFPSSMLQTRKLQSQCPVVANTIALGSITKRFRSSEGVTFFRTSYTRNKSQFAETQFESRQHKHTHEFVNWTRLASTNSTSRHQVVWNPRDEMRWQGDESKWDDITLYTYMCLDHLCFFFYFVAFKEIVKGHLVQILPWGSWGRAGEQHRF